MAGWEHLDFDTEVITPQDRREEWTHGNTVAELADGNLVVSFRNISTVAIVERRTGRIVWEYHDQSLFDFFSPYVSGAQRLANGNTLICEGCDGRIFEVTAEGAVVWEYVNPHFFREPGRPGLNNWVFRAFRYTPDEIERARRA